MEEVDGLSSDRRSIVSTRQDLIRKTTMIRRLKNITKVTTRTNSYENLLTEAKEVQDKESEKYRIDSLSVMVGQGTTTYLLNY